MVVISLADSYFTFELFVQTNSVYVGHREESMDLTEIVTMEAVTCFSARCPGWLCDMAVETVKAEVDEKLARSDFNFIFRM